MVARNRTTFSKLASRLTLGVAASLGMAAIHSPASASLRITEVMSNSGIGGTQDWFELTNYGLAPVSLTGYRMDDNSFIFNPNSVPLTGVASIAPGESVVFVEAVTLDPAAEVASFRTYWGGAATTAAIGTYSGSGVGFSSNGDGVVVFDAAGTEVTPRTSFGSAVATPGQSFYWAYNPAGDFVLGTQSNGVVSTVGTIPGENGGISQVTYLSATTLPQNTGSPGTAAVVPEPSTVALAAAGLGLVGMAARRRLQRS